MNGLRNSPRHTQKLFSTKSADPVVARVSHSSLILWCAAQQPTPSLPVPAPVLCGKLNRSIWDHRSFLGTELQGFGRGEDLLLLGGLSSRRAFRVTLTKVRSKMSVCLFCVYACVCVLLCVLPIESLSRSARRPPAHSQCPC